MLRILPLLLTLLAAVPSRPAGAQFRDLVRRVPSSANALIVLNVDQILNSPIAREQQWGEQQEKAAAAGLTLVPPTAEQFVFGAHFDFEAGRPNWEVTLANVSYDISIPRIATQFGGNVERLRQRNAVRLPSDAYVVEIGRQILGARRPGNRQSVSQWIASWDASTSSRLSDYLNQAASYVAEGGTPIIMALDLEGAVSVDDAKAALAASEEFKQLGLDIDQVAEALGNIDGVTLGITLRDRPFGELKVDFNQDVTFLGDAAKKMLLTTLANRGAMINEFADWDSKVVGNRVQIEGFLERSGMQRIMSILEPPPEVRDHIQQGGSASGTPGVPSTGDQVALQRAASQQYFQSVAGYINDLRRRPEAQTMGQVGQWIGNYARKIDSLPMLNVDPELLDWGMFVSNSLRKAEQSLRSQGGRARVRSIQAAQSGGGAAAYNTTGRWGAWGYDYYNYFDPLLAKQQQDAVQLEQVNVRTQERVSAASDARAIMQDIADSMVDIRRRMTQKYQAEF